MHRGYIKLWRKIEDWTWYKNTNTFCLWLHLLISANYKDSSYMGYPVPRGSMICGRKALSEQTGLSVKNVRTALNHLKSTNDVAIKTTNKFSIVSIVNFELYQDRETSESAIKAANNRPTTGQQPATSKEHKNCKNIRIKTGSSVFSKDDTESIKSVISRSTGWAQNSEAVALETRNIERTILGSKKKIERPIAYAIGMAKKVKGSL